MPGVGIGYLDEHLMDRDERRVLWSRWSVRRAVGRPCFGQVHPLRQRRAMGRLLCQVCAGPADRTEDGVLWLLKDHRDDWVGWPNRMAVSEPPICVRLSVRVCPALRRGAVVVRAGSYPIAGVIGMEYRCEGDRTVAVGRTMVEYGDPMARWVLAEHLLRRLGNCALIEVDTLVTLGVEG